MRRRIIDLSNATKLGKSFHSSAKYEVVLIDKSSTHVWIMLHTFAAGTGHPYQEKISFLARANQNDFHYFNEQH